MGILYVLGHALLSIACSIVASTIEPRLKKLAQHLQKKKSPADQSRGS